MSKMKLVLDVVQNLRSLADSLAALAEAAAADDRQEPMPIAPDTPSNVSAPPDQPEWKNPPTAAETPGPLNTAAEEDDDALRLDLVSLRAAVAQYTSPVNRPKIKAILTQFGVRKLTELKEEQYPAVLSEVVKACET